MRLHPVDILTQLRALLCGHFLLAARFFQLLDQRVRLRSCARDDALRLLLGAFDLAFRVGSRALRLVLRLLLFGVRLGGQAVRVLHLLFQTLPLLFELADNVLELAVVARDKFLRALDYAVVHTETA